MSLKNLTHHALIESTRAALQAALEAELNVLKHFQEIERRRLWIHAGSVYKFIKSTFELTDDQIYPRLQAMRLMTAIPEVEDKIEQGQLSITNALKAHQVFSAEGKKREVTLEEKRSVLESLENVSTRAADQMLADKYPVSNKPRERVKPVAKNQNLIQFYVDDETLAQIEEMKAKYSHQMPTGKMEDLLKILLRLANRQVQTRKRVTIKTRSRHIQAQVKRELENARHEGCAHLNPKTGVRCGSKHFLQYDHIHEYSKGGSNEAYNLRWLCGFHNRNRGETGRDAPQSHAHNRGGDFT